MVSISEAYELVVKNTLSLSGELRDLKSASAYYLAEDVISPINMPPFRQSAMDGYALNLHSNKEYHLIGEVKAGDREQVLLKPGEAVRIFTGAPVPDSANAVIMQEKVIPNGTVVITETSVSEQENIRPVGEQVMKNAKALSKGTLLTPAAIGFLSSLGITKVNVIRKPNIAIVSTGNELIEPGKFLSHGKIYESNTAMLSSALHTIHFNDTDTFKVKDNYPDTFNLIDRLINEYDVVLLTGGISVGDYDFVGKALKELDVKELFYKVDQKPGKPLYFGKKGKATVFALPGNPAATLSCFYIYVRACLELLSGNNDYQLHNIKAASGSEFIKRGDRPQFLKSILKDNKVEILEGQNSSMLQTFAIANALVYLPGEVNHINVGTIVDVISLPL